MTEADTRSKLIDPFLLSHGWTENHIKREQIVQAQIWNKRQNRFADYVLSHNHTALAVLEAKADTKNFRDGVTQAKIYADKLNVRFAFSTNGHRIYQMDLISGEEKEITKYPSPDELWAWTYPINTTGNNVEEWREQFFAIPWERMKNRYLPYYYQKSATHAVLSAIAEGKKRLLITLATGTGKTAIAFHIAWKLFQSRWTLSLNKKRKPRILFLADRINLASQAEQSFSSFGKDAISYITPQSLKKNIEKTTNANIFFSIYQTFSTKQGDQDIPFYGTLAPDFFDLIIIDECHRGGAKEDSSWADILKYFSHAVQLGMTATPKRDDNIDTYDYFGKPLYTYSLKDGITDGYLTPFKVTTYSSNIDDYKFVEGDIVLAGELDKNKTYPPNEINNKIIIEDRERFLIQKFLNNIKPYEKTIVFCKDQEHAALVRDLINQEIKSSYIDYCVRVTSDEKEIGNNYLKQFQDNEKNTPVILTSSQKLTTGVDARNVRHIVLFKSINTMIDFKQIIGRGTRLFNEKEYFMIHDFYDNHLRLKDSDWDGEPIDPISSIVRSSSEFDEELEKLDPTQRPTTIEVQLSDGRIKALKCTEATLFYGKDGKILSAQEFLQYLFDVIPPFFNDEEHLKAIWIDRETRKHLLDQLAKEGVSLENLIEIQKMIESEDSDVFDVLEYFAYNKTPVPKTKRADIVRKKIYYSLSEEQKEFTEYLLNQYIDEGHSIVDITRIPELMNVKYNSFQDGLSHLKIDNIQLESLFFNIQDGLYSSQE